MEREKIWTKDFLLLLMSNFFVSLTFYILMTTMAVYAIRQFNTTESKAGLAASIFIIGTLLARFIAGKFIDVIGRTKMLYCGLILFLIGCIAYLSAESIEFLMVVRFIHGIGFGLVSTTLSTINMSTLPANKKGEGMGYYSLSTATGTAIGPFLALYLTNNFGYNVLFISCILFSVMALISTALGTIVDIDLTPEQKEKIKKSLHFQDFYDKQALPIALLMFICGIAYSGVISFINLYASRLNLTKAASFFFVVYAVFLFVGRPVVGRIFDRRGENTVIYPSFISFVIGLLLITLAKNGFMLLLAGVFLALGYGTLMSSMQTIVGKLAPPHRLGLAISTFFICMDAGMGTGPYILGLIVERYGFRTMYGFLAIAVVCLIPAYYLLHGKRASLAKPII